MKTTSTSLLTQSQEFALERMTALAKLHFAQAETGAVRLRTLPLVIGPSGVGKSHLLRELGARLGLPVMKLTVGDWIIQGARMEPSTCRRLRSELERDEPMVLQIDELDKFSLTPDPWTRCLFGEVFGILDGTPGPVIKNGASLQGGWTETLVQRLRSRCFTIGAGTWQELWSSDRPRRAIGFHQQRESLAAPDHEALRERVRTTRAIPDELLNRFNASWLFLDPLTREDFARIAERLSLGREILDPVRAEASGLNFRYVENVMTDAAVAQLRQNPAPSTRQLELLSVPVPPASP